MRLFFFFCCFFFGLFFLTLVSPTSFSWGLRRGHRFGVGFGSIVEEALLWLS